MVWISIWMLQMDIQTEEQTYSSDYNIDIKGYNLVKKHHFWPHSFANSFVKSILK